MKKLLSYLTVLLSVTYSFSQNQKTPSQKIIIQTIDSIRKAHNIPELGFAVVTPDSIKILDVMGLHQHNGSEKAALTDRFHLGSDTKAITGYIAARLVEKGKISWDTKFLTIFPEWSTLANPAYIEITLAELLSHRAHIQPYTDDEEYKTLPTFTGSPMEKRKQFSKYLLGLAPVEDTTAPYIYSNGGYSMATAMLEKVSNKSWEQLLKEEMNLLKVNPELGFPAKQHKNQPWGHDENLKPLPPDDPYIIPEIIAPAGDVNMTLGDYALFIKENMKGLDGNSRFLKKETFQYLHFGIPNYAIGWGWGINKEKQKVSAHSGSGGTFYCQNYLISDTHTAYIVVANSATETTDKGIHAIIMYLRGINF